MHPVCFKDTPISPNSERCRDHTDSNMNRDNTCSYFEASESLATRMDNFLKSLWGFFK